MWRFHSTPQSARTINNQFVLLIVVARKHTNAHFSWRCVCVRRTICANGPLIYCVGYVRSNLNELPAQISFRHRRSLIKLCLCSSRSRIRLWPTRRVATEFRKTFLCTHATLEHTHFLIRCNTCAADSAVVAIVTIPTWLNSETIRCEHSVFLFASYSGVVFFVCAKRRSGINDEHKHVQDHLACSRPRSSGTAKNRV